MKTLNKIQYPVYEMNMLNALNLKTGASKVIITKKGVMNKFIKSAVRNCQYSEKNLKFYPCTWRNNGRNLEDYTERIKGILEGQGYKVRSGNDSPRGGAEGRFLKVSKKGMAFFSLIEGDRRYLVCII